MNTTIECLPKPDSPFLDRSVRLTNATGQVVVEIDDAQAWLVEANKRFPMHMQQLRGVLAGYFAAPENELDLVIEALQAEVDAWGQLSQHPMLFLSQPLRLHPAHVQALDFIDELVASSQEQYAENQRLRKELSETQFWLRAGRVRYANVLTTDAPKLLPAPGVNHGHP